MRSNRLLLRSSCHIQYQGFISFPILHLTMQVTISCYQSPTVGKSASKLCHCWAQECVDPTSSASYFTHSWVPSSGFILTIHRRIIPKHQKSLNRKKVFSNALRSTGIHSAQVLQLSVFSCFQKLIWYLLTLEYLRIERLGICQGF